SYAIAQTLTTADSQAKEAAAFATLPANPDALDVLKDLPAEGWVKDVVAAGSQELGASRPLPSDPNAEHVAAQYVTIWRALVQGQVPDAVRNGDPAALKAWLAPYAQQIRG